MSQLVLLIGGSRHGEFEAVSETDHTIMVAAPPTRFRIDWNDPWSWRDVDMRVERYEVQKIGFQGVTGVSLRGRVAMITPRRHLEPTKMLGTWAIEMILWKEGLSKTKPERYPI